MSLGAGGDQSPDAATAGAVSASDTRPFAGHGALKPRHSNPGGRHALTPDYLTLVLAVAGDARVVAVEPDFIAFRATSSVEGVISYRPAREIGAEAGLCDLPPNSPSAAVCVPAALFEGVR